MKGMYGVKKKTHETEIKWISNPSSPVRKGAEYFPEHWFCVATYATYVPRWKYKISRIEHRSYFIHSYKRRWTRFFFHQQRKICAREIVRRKSAEFMRKFAACRNSIAMCQDFLDMLEWKFSLITPKTDGRLCRWCWFYADCNLAGESELRFIAVYTFRGAEVKDSKIRVV